MSAFRKADVQNVGVEIVLDVCLWPKADIRTESKSVFLNGCFGGKSRHSGVRVTGKGEWPQSTQSRRSSLRESGNKLLRFDSEMGNVNVVSASMDATWMNRPLPAVR